MRSLTFELPPSPRCVVQRRTVVLRVEDAFALMLELREKLDALAPGAPVQDPVGTPADEGRRDGPGIAAATGSTQG